MPTEEKMKFFDKIFDLYNQLQKEEKFTNSTEPVMHLIYHLSLKHQRSLKTMQIILESSEIKNSYIETLPLLRIQLETFFHIIYITEHKDFKICIEEYEKLQKLQLYRIANNYKKLDKEKPNRINADEQEFMNLHKNSRIPRDIDHLDKLWKLAQTTHRYEEYVRIYSLLSSYIHYNPSTRETYGSKKGNKIIYNQFTYNEQEENIILQYSIGIALSALNYINNFLDIQILQEKTDKTLIEWQNTFKRNKTE